jgi:para-nitrobenzyl esterase
MRSLAFLPFFSLAFACAFGCSGCGSSSSNGGDTDSGATTDSGTGDVSTDTPTACNVDTSPKPGKAIVEQGAVVGATSGGTYAFLGIPYAAPPVAGLRWMPPQPAACWDGEKQTTAFGTICMQQTQAGAVTGGEDCLTINVWTPSDFTADAKMPVLVFVHGGANIVGSSSDATTDGSKLYDGAALSAARHVVVVTFNYRVAAMGFFAHAGLDAERTQNASGDWGLHDQVAALQWVQKNAHAFGGDPTHLLLFGQSAGATDVGILYASPLAKGLFSAVLAESGGWDLQSHAKALDYGKKLVDGAGCTKSTDADTIACLRALPPDAIVKALPQSFDLAAPTGTIFQPSVDGWIVPDEPTTIVTAGKHNAVPFVLGSNGAEISAYVPATMTDADYRARLLALAGTAAGADAVYAQYPPSDWGTPRDAFVAAISDAIFTCPTRRMARAAAKGQTLPVHRYFFTHGLANVAPALAYVGAFHGLELAFVFRHLSVNGYAPSTGEGALSDAIDDYWTRLASTGDVGGSPEPAWPIYDGASDPYLQLEDPIATGASVHGKQCDFWDAVPSGG